MKLLTEKKKKLCIQRKLMCDRCLPSLTHFRTFQNIAEYWIVGTLAHSNGHRKRNGDRRKPTTTNILYALSRSNNKKRTALNRVSNGNSMNAMLRAMNTIDLYFAFIRVARRVEIFTLDVCKLARNILKFSIIRLLVGCSFDLNKVLPRIQCWNCSKFVTSCIVKRLTWRLSNERLTWMGNGFRCSTLLPYQNRTSIYINRAHPTLTHSFAHAKIIFPWLAATTITTQFQIMGKWRNKKNGSKRNIRRQVSTLCIVVLSVKRKICAQVVSPSMLIFPNFVSELPGVICHLHLYFWECFFLRSMWTLTVNPHNTFEQTTKVKKKLQIWHI